jgi:hypothetical protein
MLLETSFVCRSCCATGKSPEADDVSQPPDDAKTQATEAGAVAFRRGIPVQAGSASELIARLMGPGR